MALASGAAGAVATGGTGWDALLDGLNIALSGNAFNLLDTAPGRAASAWLAAALALGAAAPAAQALLMPLAASLAAYLPLDLGARAMMGDAGAYALGGALGAGLAVLPRPARLWALGLLLAFNLVLDRWSLSGGWRRARTAVLLAAQRRAGRRQPCYATPEREAPRGQAGKRRPPPPSP
ncbi:MAG: hypothetical protein K6T75_07875 [Acetobacteraceae bacterium]|nr:hypothetical protein [Acetobacteraceae bacterium]